MNRKIKLTKLPELYIDLEDKSIIKFKNCELNEDSIIRIDLKDVENISEIKLLHNDSDTYYLIEKFLIPINDLLKFCKDRSKKHNALKYITLTYDEIKSLAVSTLKVEIYV